MSRVKTRPGRAGQRVQDLELDVCRRRRPRRRAVTARLPGSMRRPRDLDRALVVGVGLRAMPERRSAAFTRERNSRIENGLVM